MDHLCLPFPPKFTYAIANVPCSTHIPRSPSVGDLWHCHLGHLTKYHFRVLVNKVVLHTFSFFDISLCIG